MILNSFLGPMTNLLKKLLERLEFKNYQDAVKRNPSDHGLRVRFAKYCLRHYFTHQVAAQAHLVEAVNQYETISRNPEVYDLEIFYLMGKYYHGQDNEKAIEVYRQGIRKFNHCIEQNPGLKHEFVELAFGIAMNLLALEANRTDADLEHFFKIVRKTYLKRFLTEKVDVKLEQSEPMAVPAT
jgi:hypothetical protein